MKLSELSKGSRAMIVSVNSSPLEVTLMQLGVVTGDIITLSDFAPFGGPLAMQVGGNKVALRRSDAARIEVKMLT